MNPRRTTAWIIPVSIAVAIATALLSPYLFQKKNGTNRPVARPSAVNPGSFSAKGVVESTDDVEVGAQAGGIIRSLFVKEGDFVKKGQRLFSIDDSKITAQLARSRAATHEARARLSELESGSRREDIDMISARVNRAETVYAQAKEESLRQDRLLFKEATTRYERDRAYERMKIALDELNDAKANLQKVRRGERKEEIEKAQAALARAVSEEKYYSELLRDYGVTAPFDGVISECHKKEGESVEIGTPVIRIINPRSLRIRAELEETDVGKVIVGQRVEIDSDAFREKIFPGEVYKVFPNVKKKSQKTFDPMASFDINTQTFYVRLQKYEGFQPGMTVTVRISK